MSSRFVMASQIASYNINSPCCCFVVLTGQLAGQVTSCLVQLFTCLFQVPQLNGYVKRYVKSLGKISLFTSEKVYYTDSFFVVDQLCFRNRKKLGRYLKFMKIESGKGFFRFLLKPKTSRQLLFACYCWFLRSRCCFCYFIYYHHHHHHHHHHHTVMHAA